MKAFFDKFQSLNGAKIIGIENYTNKHGEVAHVSVNVNIKISEAKRKDLIALKSLSYSDLENIANSHSLPIDTLKIALAELIVSGEKNVSKDMEERTNQSKAQADSYIRITKGVKMHKETTQIFVEGFYHGKTVIVDGVYPTVNKREKTLCKDAIGDHCSLRMKHYRIYKVTEIDKINITGSTLQMK